MLGRSFASRPLLNPVYRRLRTVGAVWIEFDDVVDEHMNVKVTTLSFAIAVNCFLCSFAVAADSLPAYAPVKTMGCGQCRRDALKIVLPRDFLPERGVVFGYGGGLNPDASWTIVDIDKHQLTLAQTALQANGQSTVTSSEMMPLSDDELLPIIQTANTLWNPKSPRSYQSGVSPDCVWGLDLLDGHNIYDIQEMCGPEGVSDDVKPLENAVRNAFQSARGRR